MSLSNKLYHLFESPKFFGSLKEEVQPLGNTPPSLLPWPGTLAKKRSPRKKSAPRKKKEAVHCCCSLPELPSVPPSVQSFEGITPHQSKEKLKKETI